MENTSEEKCSVPFYGERELRLGVVLYGGVSLAIYIHGVTKELMSMIRATAPSTPARPWQRQMGRSGSTALYSNEQLTGAEHVYRRLGQMLGRRELHRNASENCPIRTRIVVDILAGTSAGGINAIFLAKALAMNASLDSLAELWVNEGDLSKLVNDAKSVDADTHSLGHQQPPRSLLDSRKMYVKLLRALQTVSESAKPTDTLGSPLVDELDLFITATDLEGLPLPIQLYDRFVYERKHRAIFPFRYSPLSAPAQHDFVQDNDPFLAFAARCTSAFPFAFEPMRLSDIDEVVQTPLFGKGAVPYGGSATVEWRKFYGDYLRPRPGEPSSRASVDTRAQRFARVAFGDGGYLDNKPFTRVLATIRSRSASVPVDRKLIYVEPAPAHPEDDPVTPHTPDALQNVIKALVELPRYETIREDIEDVRAFNRLVERLDLVRSGRDRDVGRLGHNRPRLPSTDEWLHADLTAMVANYGLGYGTYHRLKVAAVSDEISRLLVRVFGLDEESDDLRAIRYLIGAWRGRNFKTYKDAANIPTENEFLYRFDVWWRIRRLRQAVSIAGEVADLLRHSDSVGFVERFREVLDELGVPLDVRIDREAEPIALAVKAGLAEAQQVLLDVVRSLHEHLFPMGTLAEIQATIDKRALREIVEGRSDEERRQRAAGFVEKHLAQLGLVAEALERRIEPARKTAGAIAGVLLHGRRESEFWLSAVPTRMLELHALVEQAGQVVPRRVIAHYYDRFEEYDQLTYPLLFAREAGEIDPIEIVRISPEDSKTLYDERGQDRLSRDEGQPRVRVADAKPKLAGTAFSNLGAFLAKDWRCNDMLWGRLDGAERLIQAALSDQDDADLAHELILEAHEAILEQELGPRKLKEVIETLGEDYSTALRNADGWLKHFDGDVRAPKIHAVLMRCINKQRRSEFFVAVSQSNRDPPARPTVQTLARATDVVGQMLGDLSERYGFNPGRRWAAMLARFGRALWHVVQVSVPRSLPNLFYRHLVGLLYLFEAFLIVGGIVFSVDEVARLGWLTLAATLGFQALVAVLATGSWAGGMRLVRKLGVGLAALLIVLGVFYLAKHASSDIAKARDNIITLLTG